MTENGGYDRTMTLAQERPELIPLLRLIASMGEREFNDGLDELARRGILQKDFGFHPRVT